MIPRYRVMSPIDIRDGTLLTRRSARKSPSLAVFIEDSLHSLLASTKNFTIRCLQNWRAGDKKYVHTFQKIGPCAVYFTHSSLCGVSPHCVPKLFSRNKSNTTARVVLQWLLFFTAFIHTVRHDERGKLVGIAPIGRENA